MANPCAILLLHLISKTLLVVHDPRRAKLQGPPTTIRLVELLAYSLWHPTGKPFGRRPFGKTFRENLWGTFYGKPLGKTFGENLEGKPKEVPQRCSHKSFPKGSPERFPRCSFPEGWFHVRVTDGEPGTSHIWTFLLAFTSSSGQ